MCVPTGRGLLWGAGVSCALMWASSALAQAPGGEGYSIDIELLQPSFGHRAFTGVDVPVTHRSTTVRAGTLLQYQQTPLMLSAITDGEVGRVVANRFAATVGASVDLQRVTFGVTAPMALSWGSEAMGREADGFGVGDVGLSARWAVASTQRDGLSFGLRTGVRLPTGQQRSYLGEGRVRASAGGLLAANVGPVLVATDIGVSTRRAVETEEDFLAATEVTWANAARLMLPAASRLSLNAQAMSRAGIQRFLRGGAENSLEVLAGVDIYPTAKTTVGIAAGRGLNQGYGTTDFRMVGNVTMELAPPVRPMYYRYDPPEGPRSRKPVGEPLEDRNTEPPEAVTDVGTELQLRDPLRFEVRTAKLLPESLPTLQAVADLINTDPTIGLVVVEGHASQEGDLAFNYWLADQRARRIWELLQERGVASARLAYRHFGETVPVTDVLAKNRRVEFVVAVRYSDEDQAPEYPTTQRLQWSGEEVPVVRPQWPADPLDLLDDDLDEF